MKNQRVKRRYYIDNLRTTTTFFVVLFHTICMFTTLPWLIKNPQNHQAFTLFYYLLLIVLMPIFFTISGINTHISFYLNSFKTTLIKRFNRLIIPFLFGVFVLSPPIVYLEFAHKNLISRSFLDFLPHYLNGLYGFGGNFAFMGIHLWYLPTLFLFTLLAIPIGLFFKAHQQLFIRLVVDLQKPLRIYLLCLPIIAIEYLTSFHPLLGLKYMGGWSMMIYPLFFFYGMIFAEIHFQYTITNQRNYSLLFSLITLPLYLLSLTTTNLLLQSILLGSSSWFLLLTILGYSFRYLDYTSPYHKHANQISMPIYIIHLPILITTGYILIQYNLSALTGFLVAFILCIFLSLLFSDVLIVKLRKLRVLFGLPLKKRKEKSDKYTLEYSTTHPPAQNP